MNVAFCLRENGFVAKMVLQAQGTYAFFCRLLLHIRIEIGLLFFCRPNLKRNTKNMLHFN